MGVAAAVLVGGACGGDSGSESAPETTLAAPDATYVDLATRLDLTPEGEQLLFSLPIDFGGRTDALEQCEEREPLPVMGCASEDGAFVIEVDEQRFPGMRDLAVAHLLLHEAWDQLPAFGRKGLEQPLLEATTDPGVQLYLAAAGQGGLDVATERFAVVGSQVDDVDPALAELYGHWFGDRDLILFTAATATGGLQGAQAELAALAAQLDARLPDLRARDDELGPCPVGTEPSAAMAELARDKRAFNEVAMEHNELRTDLVNHFPEIPVPGRQTLLTCTGPEPLG